MCEPTTMAYIAIGTAIAGSAASMYSQSQQAGAQAQYQQAMADANAKQMQENAELANNSYIESMKQLQIKNMQESAAATQQIIQNDTSAKKAIATAQTSAGDAGVSGLSVDALLADFHRQQDNYDTTVRVNQQWAKDQLNEDEKGYQAQAQGRIASVRPYVQQPVKTPDYLGTSLGAFKDVYSIGNTAKLWEDSTK